MTLKIEDTQKIANLARLTLSDAEATRLTLELNQYLDWINKLQNINTKDTEPLTSVLLASVNENQLRARKDEVQGDNIAEKILKNAPDSKNNFFTVPKVVE